MCQKLESSCLAVDYKNIKEIDFKDQGNRYKLPYSLKSISVTLKVLQIIMLYNHKVIQLNVSFRPNKGAAKKTKGIKYQ